MKKRLLHLLMILCAALTLCVAASAASVTQVSTDAQLRAAAANASISELPLTANISLESTLEIKISMSYGIPLVRIVRDGRREDTLRDYSSPKRAFNAIGEIVRCAGFEM